MSIYFKSKLITVLICDFVICSCILWVGDLNYRFSALKWTSDDTFVYANRIENLIVKALAKELHYQKLFDADEV
jgi:hypothetical protein